jgi:hypothetical protein
VGNSGKSRKIIRYQKSRNGCGNPGVRVGPKFKDRVRDAYFLADLAVLRKTYRILKVSLL